MILLRYQLNIAKIIVLSRAGDHRSPLHLKFQVVGVYFWSTDTLIFLLKPLIFSVLRISGF
ncbi:MAG: hypothetical protein R3Y53_03450 [Bacillota bacterium]